MRFCPHCKQLSTVQSCFSPLKFSPFQSQAPIIFAQSQLVEHDLIQHEAYRVTSDDILPLRNLLKSMSVLLDLSLKLCSQMSIHQFLSFVDQDDQ